jgi:hypothetical protein
MASEKGRRYDGVVAFLCRLVVGKTRVTPLAVAEHFKAGFVGFIETGDASEQIEFCEGAGASE